MDDPIGPHCAHLRSSRPCTPLPTVQKPPEEIQSRWPRRFWNLTSEDAQAILKTLAELEFLKILRVLHGCGSV